MYKRQDTDRPTDVISLEYKPELDISFDEEELAENPELAEMMGEMCIRDRLKCRINCMKR